MKLAAGGLGIYVRERRQALGLSLTELGQRAGLSEQAISAIELGERRRIQGTTALRLARALGVETDDLLALILIASP